MVLILVSTDCFLLSGDFHGCSLRVRFTVKDDYSKNDYGQKEARDGDITKGQYHVLLPDGRTQKVSYTVDSYNGRHSFKLFSVKG